MVYEPSVGVEVVVSFLDIFSALCNFAVFMLIVTKPSLRTVSNTLLCGLIISDFLMATLIVPFSILGYKHKTWMYADAICTSQGFMFNTIYIFSGTLTSVISIDRYYLLSNPMSHTANVQLSHIAWIFVLVLLYSIFWASFPLYRITGLEYTFQATESRCNFTWTVSGSLGAYLFFYSLVCFFLPFLANIVMYYKSVQAALDSARKIRPGNVKIERFANGDFTTVAKSENVCSMKAVLTVSVIVGSFVVSRAPVLVCSIGTWYEGRHFCSSNLNLGFSWMQYFGLLTNPFVYTLLDRRLRAEIKNTVKSWVSPRNEEDEEPRDILDYLRNISNPENDPIQTRDRLSVGTSNFSTEVETLQFGGPSKSTSRSGSNDNNQDTKNPQTNNQINKQIASSTS